MRASSRVAHEDLVFLDGGVRFPLLARLKIDIIPEADIVNLEYQVLDKRSSPSTKTPRGNGVFWLICRAHRPPRPHFPVIPNRKAVRLIPHLDEQVEILAA